MDIEKVVRNGAFNSVADRPISHHSTVDGLIQPLASKSYFTRNASNTSAIYKQESIPSSSISLCCLKSRAMDRNKFRKLVVYFYLTVCHFDLRQVHLETEGIRSFNVCEQWKLYETSKLAFFQESREV